MRVIPVAFSASGLIGTAPATKHVVSPVTGADFNAWNYGADNVTNSTVAVPAEPKLLAGVAYSGFTSVKIFNGTANTDDLVLISSTTGGTVALAFPIYCDKGLYVEVAGSGKGTVWIA